MDVAASRALRGQLRGSWVSPTSAEYDDARRVWNRRVDCRPAGIVRVADTADVVTAIRVARRHQLPVALRSSGHHIAGLAVRDDGLVIDLSGLKGRRVDVQRRLAQAQPGVTWGELDAATQAAALATTGGRISSVAIAGLTLGGGYGWLMRRFGLTIDNLQAAQVVSADGDVIVASETEHPDLFWALRGGGGNFGVVTRFEYRLHPLGPAVTGGAVFYAAEQAPAVLRGFRSLMDAAPETLGALFNILRLPAAPFVPERLHGTPAVAIAVCHSGTVEQARRDLQPLEDMATPLLVRLGRTPYARVQRLFDAAGAYGSFVHGASGQLARIDDAMAAVLLRFGEWMPSVRSIVMLSALGGAISRTGKYETAFSHRASAYAYSIDSVWTDPAQTAAAVAWTDAFAAAMRPFTTGVYVNELGNEPGGIERAYAPATLERLRDVKRRYDPDNFFDANHNVAPVPVSAAATS